ncbi:MAG: FAD:protein FMN transferase [Kiritimatiellaeota bacterium]|nr:FAD:protein FMN transferase [Kiritimatiellota bacterium]
MSTVFELMIVEEDRQLAQSAAYRVFQKVDRMEQMLSRFLDVSEVAQVRDLKPGQALRVPPEMMDVLLISTEVCAATQGAFDVTVGTIMDVLREVKHRWAGLTQEERDGALAACGMNRLIIDRENFLIAVKPDRLGNDSPLELDFGAIGKGYALDVACDMLTNEWEFTDFLMHGGTSTVVARGSMGDGQDGWPVGVCGDWKQRAGFDAIRLKDMAISGSGFEEKGTHIVDVRKGVAAVRHGAVWSSAPTAALSDGLSTAFLGMTWQEVKVACDALPGCGALVAREQPVWMDKLRTPVRKYRFAEKVAQVG